MIPTLTPITAGVRQPNERLWFLEAKERSKTITAPETRELNLIFASLEQDNRTGDA